MTFSASYIQFLIHFHGDRDYFECHEVLEDYWKDNGMERDSVWVGLIQVAVSFYHYRRGNIKGAIKMIDKALSLLIYKKTEIQALGIQHKTFLHKLKTSKLKMQTGLPYLPICLPIIHKDLYSICLNKCNQLGFKWDSSNDEAPYEIIHKHKLRDRSHIVANRQAKLAQKIG